jgi:two-component system sensor histidine kinase ArlS
LALTASVLLIYTSVIYFTAKNDREKEFFSLLKKEALTKGNLYFEAQVDVQILQEIYKTNRQLLNEVEVAIYDPDFQLLYHDAVEIDFVKESKEMIDKIYNSGEIRFYQNDWQVIGLRYPYEDKIYIITAAAFDEYGYNKLENLLRSSIVVFVTSLIALFVLGYYFSHKILFPIKVMINRVKKVSASYLHLRLPLGKNKDELYELSETFNKMLSRLESSFDSQKLFVSNISHEIRTPLAAIITELEISENKDRNIEEYKKVITNVLEDAKKMAKLSTNLLDFAKASYDPALISYKNLRVDEILLDAQQELIKVYKDFQISIAFAQQHYEDDNLDAENKIIVKGNEYLLKTAFKNLMENGCKFSESKSMRVTVSFESKYVVLLFTDFGIGIPADEIEHLSTPFFRGKNKNFAEGNGIGLALTYKIVALHNGSISVDSKKGETNFKLKLPHL